MPENCLSNLRTQGKKTLVLDLDETLVHSSFEELDNPDILLPVKANYDRSNSLEIRFEFKAQFITSK